MSSRTLLAPLAVLAALFFGPDLTGEVDVLRAEVDELRERVLRLEERVERRAPERAAPATEAERIEREVVHLEQRLALEEDAELDLAARVWRAKLHEAGAQAYLFATQIAGNEGYLRVEGRPQLGSREVQRVEGARIAAHALETHAPGDAFRGIEVGVRELFARWCREARRPPENVDGMLTRWRNMCLSIVREKLEQGAAWHATLTAN